MRVIYHNCSATKQRPHAGLWGHTLGENWPPEPTSSYASIDFWCQLVANLATTASWMSVVTRSNGGLSISGCIGQLSCLTIFSTSLSVAAFLRRAGGSMLGSTGSHGRGVERRVPEMRRMVEFNCTSTRLVWADWFSPTDSAMNTLAIKHQVASFSETQWVTWKNRSDLVLKPSRLSDWQITRSDRSSD